MSLAAGSPFGKKVVTYKVRVVVRDPKKPDAPTYDDFYAMVRPAASRNK